MEQISKKVSESATEQIQIVMPEHINGFHRLFGGQLMEWIDVVAGVVARRHSNCEVTTASIDNLQFKAAAHVNSTIVLSGKITYVGHTSMEVRVDTYVEELDGRRIHINKAYLVMVALDKEEKPCPVPQLIIESEEEKTEWEAATKRNSLRKSRRIEKY